MILCNKFKLNFIQKEKQSGSHMGMRFIFQKAEDSLLVTYYPEPYCLEKTPEKLRHSQIFPFDAQGLEQAVSWLNERYEENPGYWEKVYKNRMSR